MSDVIRRSGTLLRCVIEAAEPVALVRVSGCLDPAGVVDRRALLHEAVAADPAAVIVDVGGIDVPDSLVLTMFSAFARSAGGWPGCPVLLCGVDAALGAELARTGVSRIVATYPDRAGALAVAGAAPVPQRYARRMAPHPTSALMARRFVANTCRTWGLDVLVDDAELVITELVSNAVRHAGGEFTVLALLGERYLHLSVRDGSAVLPGLPRLAADLREGGRGMLLIAAIAAGWGSRAAPDGKVVWATLRRPLV